MPFAADDHHRATGQSLAERRVGGDPAHLAAINEIEIFIALRLGQAMLFDELLDLRPLFLALGVLLPLAIRLGVARGFFSLSFGTRSEERRVGKECRSGWSPYQ